MSLIDYGFDIFAFLTEYKNDVYQPCGDYILDDVNRKSNVLKTCCQNDVINYLIDLGSNTERELEIIRNELYSYKLLDLSHKQIIQSRNATLSCNGSSDTFIRSSNFDDNHSAIDENLQNNNENESNNQLEPVKKFGSDGVPVQNCNERNMAFYRKDAKPTLVGIKDKYMLRQWPQNTIFDAIGSKSNGQKVSEIMATNVVKEVELKEMQEKNKQLEIDVDNLKNKIDLLKKNSQTCKAQLDEILLQNSKELDIIRANSEKLGQDLDDERESRKVDANEIAKLQAYLHNTEVVNRNILEESNVIKHRLESHESTEISQTILIKKLQQDCTNFEKQIEKQEGEIEKLLNIIERLNEKYNKSKVDLSITKAEVEALEMKILEYRDQLTTMDSEFDKLIADLTECFGPTKSLENDCSEEGKYIQGKEITRGFVKIVREHENCRDQRVKLLNEIERLEKSHQAYAGLKKMIDDIYKQFIKFNEILVEPKNHKKVKEDEKNILDNLMSLFDNNRSTMSGQPNFDIVNGLSIKLQNVNNKLNSFEDSQILLLEIEKMQEALINVYKIIRDTVSNSKFCTLDIKKDTEYNNNSVGESDLHKRIIDHVRNCNEIISKIMDIVHSESEWQVQNKELKTQLKIALKSRDEIVFEKHQLQYQYDSCQKQCKDFVLALESMQDLLTEKSNDFQALNKKLSSFENKYQEKESMMRKRVEFIANLQKELDTKNLKICDNEKMIETLNIQLEKSENIIKQFQIMSVQEQNCKDKLEKSIMNHNKVVELMKDKNDLIEKNSSLQSQLLNMERINSRVDINLNKLVEENQFMKICISDLKRENEYLVQDIDTKAINTNLGVKCNEILHKIEKISNNCKKNQNRRVIDTINRGLETEFKNQKEKQSMPYDDKINEINQNELRKNIYKPLEIKCKGTVKDEENMLNSQIWLKYLSKNYLEELHDRIHKNPICSNSYENKPNEESKKKFPIKRTPINYNNKKSLQSKPDVRNLKISSTSAIKPNNPRYAAKEVLSNRSMVIPEKEISVGFNNARNKQLKSNFVVQCK